MGKLPLIIADVIRRKLAVKQSVSEDEIQEAFLNSEPLVLSPETRSKNQKMDPRYWFISETDRGRKLKIVFALGAKGPPHIITAYEPNATEEFFYAQEVQKKNRR
jgi:hypothetical protein